MKAILFVFSMIFSAGVFSAGVSPYDYIRPTSGMGWDYAYDNGSSGGALICGLTACNGYQQGASTFYQDNFVYGDYPPVDNDEYFHQEAGVDSDGYPIYFSVFRKFIAGDDHQATQDFEFTITYDSFGLDNLRIYAGSLFNLTAPSGSFESSVTAGSDFPLGMLGLLTDIEYADNAFFSFQFTIKPISVSAVPLPASLFLFAPALLGFIRLRRKLS